MTDIETPPRTYTKADIKRFQSNLKEEVDGAALYRLLADAEDDPHLKELFSKLAVSEDRHLALWEAKLREAGGEVPAYKTSARVRVLGWLARRFGTHFVTPIVTRMEMSAVGMYDTQPEAVEHHLPQDERSHARIFRQLSSNDRAVAEGIDIAKIEGRHRGGSGNALRAAVLGVNDGLMTSVSLVMGVAGANPGRSFVFLTGMAGLLAGSFSMALGEWLSVRSSAESFERQLDVEREELELMPEEEEAELTLIYQAKGFSEEEARRAAKRILQDPATALDTLAREELGMSGSDLANPWVARRHVIRPVRRGRDSAGAAVGVYRRLAGGDHQPDCGRGGPVPGGRDHDAFYWPQRTVFGRTDAGVRPRRSGRDVAIGKVIGVNVSA